jgi:hypothetical protein
MDKGSGKDDEEDRTLPDQGLCSGNLAYNAYPLLVSVGCNQRRDTALSHRYADECYGRQAHHLAKRLALEMLKESALAHLRMHLPTASAAHSN